MFATPAVAFHTLLSLVAILAGIFVMSMLVKNRRPDVWTLVFLVTMIVRSNRRREVDAAD